MKPKILVANVCLSFLLAATAWSAPSSVRPPSLDEITVASDDGGRGGGNGGASESWTLRADDTVSHTQSFTPSEQIQGATNINDAVGIMHPGSFNRMLNYLVWTRLLDTKVPKSNSDMPESGLTVSLVRSGKAKSVRLTYGMDAATWTTFTVVDALTRDVVWKTAAQFKAQTGLAVFYQFDDTLSPAELEQAKTFPRPIFSALNAAGKEVAELRPNTDKERTAFLSPAPTYSDSWISDKDVSSFFTLAPGTYRLAFKRLEGVAPSTAQGFAWRAIGDVTEDSKGVTAKVTTGQFNFVVIRLEKKPVQDAH